MRPATGEFLKRIKKLSFPEYVDKLILFGSEVYGTPNRNSDIDIAVVCHTPVTIGDRCAIEELIESCDPPYEFQLVYVKNTEADNRFDVKRDIFAKGLIMYERQ